jgi:indole-3-glycerol phosphate synthase
MILDKIVKETKTRVRREKQKTSLDEISALAQSYKNKLEPFAFEKALSKNDISFICEVKKASPSKGVICEDFPYLEIAKDYQAAGAACISVLTEPEFFLGKNEYLTQIKNETDLPILRKDFIIDEYQIYEAKAIGADCVLLICAVLDIEALKKYIKLCDALGLSALVEAHDEDEIKSAISAGARVVGVNNRNLKTFQVDIENSVRLRKLVPPSVLFVAESGIGTSEDINILRKAKVDAVLIGEALMKSSNKKEMLSSLRGVPCD